MFPEACAGTLLQLKEEVLPPIPELAGYLGNDLDALEESLILVLDDYQYINEPAVHELVNFLLTHQPDRLLAGTCKNGLYFGPCGSYGIFGTFATVNLA